MNVKLTKRQAWELISRIHPPAEYPEGDHPV